MRMIPRERLLIFNFSDGWGPLCEFLGKPVPDEPFPHVDRYELAGSQYQHGMSLAQRTAVRLRRKEL